MFKSIIRTPLGIFISAIAIFFAVWIASVFPADYKLAMVMQFTGLAIYLIALKLCLIWLVWRVRTIYNTATGIPEDMHSQTKAQLTCFIYVSVALVILAAAILSAS